MSDALNYVDRERGGAAQRSASPQARRKEAWGLREGTVGQDNWERDEDMKLIRTTLLGLFLTAGVALASSSAVAALGGGGGGGGSCNFCENLGWGRDCVKDDIGYGQTGCARMYFGCVTYGPSCSNYGFVWTW